MAKPVSLVSGTLKKGYELRGMVSYYQKLSGMVKKKHESNENQSVSILYNLISYRCISLLYILLSRI